MIKQAQMRRLKASGSIVNISSITAQHYASVLAYSVSSAALDQLTRSIIAVALARMVISRGLVA
jgi:NAD(P)-dependent dehydrogenase (short-subunit alcohol dehydrogenase family)